MKTSAGFVDPRRFWTVILFLTFCGGCESHTDRTASMQTPDRRHLLLRPDAVAWQSTALSIPSTWAGVTYLSGPAHVMVLPPALPSALSENNSAIMPTGNGPRILYPAE